MISGFTAVLSLALQFLLVPEYAEMGAAVAAGVTFFVWNVLAFILSHKFWPISYPWAILLAQVTAGLFATGLLMYLLKTGVGGGQVSLWAFFFAIILFASSFNLQFYQEWYKKLRTKMG